MSKKNQQATASPQEKKTNYLMFIVMTVIALAGVIGLMIARENAGQLKGSTAPDFTIDVYHSDEKFQLSEQRGKVVVVNFWGSWCGPCRDEAPYLQSTWEKYQDHDDVVIVGVGFRDTEADALAFLEEFGITYPNGADAGLKIVERYGVVAAPQTLVIDRDGIVADVYYGPLTPTWLDEAIQDVLKGEDSA